MKISSSSSVYVSFEFFLQVLLGDYEFNTAELTDIIFNQTTDVKETCVYDFYRITYKVDDDIFNNQIAYRRWLATKHNELTSAVIEFYNQVKDRIQDDIQKILDIEGLDENNREYVDKLKQLILDIDKEITTLK